MSFRAGALVGRNMDKWPAIPGAAIGAGLGGLAGFGLMKELGVNPVLGGAAGALFGAVPGSMAGRAVGRFHQGVTSGMAHAYPVKEASAVLPKKGIGRVLQLLGGSGDRIAALEGQVASRAGTSARHNAASNRLFHQSFERGVAGPAAEDANTVRSIFRNRNAYSSANRAKAALETEHQAVRTARKSAVGAGLGAGAGALLAHHDAKTASTMKTIQEVTGVSLPSMEVGAETLKRLAYRARHPKTLELVAEEAKPLLSRQAKTVGGASLAGVGAGAGAALALRDGHSKHAFGGPLGGALMAGAKGAGRFLGAAGKSIGAAAQAGGAQAAGHAALNAGRAGVMRAGNFIAQNPIAGSALVAAPALAAGYAAGRQQQ